MKRNPIFFLLLITCFLACKTEQAEQTIARYGVNQRNNCDGG